MNFKNAELSCEVIVLWEGCVWDGKKLSVCTSLDVWMLGEDPPPKKKRKKWRIRKCYVWYFKVVTQISGITLTHDDPFLVLHNVQRDVFMVLATDFFSTFKFFHEPIFSFSVTKCLLIIVFQHYTIVVLFHVSTCISP